MSIGREMELERELNSLSESYSDRGIKIAELEAKVESLRRAAELVEMCERNQHTELIEEADGECVICFVEAIAERERERAETAEALTLTYIAVVRRGEYGPLIERAEAAEQRLKDCCCVDSTCMVHGALRP